MTTQKLEYPLGSGHRISIPPDYQSIESGSRLALAGNLYLDVAEGQEVWTDEGYVTVDELVGKYVQLEQGFYSHDFDSLPNYVVDPTISVIQIRKFLVLSVEDITERTIKLTLPYGTAGTIDDDDNVYLCALLRDPCGDKYILPVTILA